MLPRQLRLVGTGKRVPLNESFSEAHQAVANSLLPTLSDYNGHRASQEAALSAGTAASGPLATGYYCFSRTADAAAATATCSPESGFWQSQQRDGHKLLQLDRSNGHSNLSNIGTLVISTAKAASANATAKPYVTIWRQLADCARQQNDGQ